MLTSIKRTVRAAIGVVVRAVLAALPDRVRVIVCDEAPIVRRLDYAKKPISLHVDSEFELRVRLRSCSREPGTVRWIEESLRDGDVFYDIGANVGAYTLVAAVECAGRVKVVAFEPSALNFGQLVRNIALNDCTASVTPLQIALGDSTRVDVFHYRSATPGAALHALGSPTDESGQVFKPTIQHPLVAYALDDAVTRFNLPEPTHLKMDVDGSEPRILAGAGRTLSAPTLRTILIEAGPGAGSAEELARILGKSGFALESTSVLAGGTTRNLVFGRPNGAARRTSIWPERRVDHARS